MSDPRSDQRANSNSRQVGQSIQWVTGASWNEGLQQLADHGMSDQQYQNLISPPQISGQGQWNAADNGQRSVSRQVQQDVADSSQRRKRSSLNGQKRIGTQQRPADQTDQSQADGSVESTKEGRNVRRHCRWKNAVSLLLVHVHAQH